MMRITFISQPGAWGFVCITHSEMNGAIWVTP
jgi:plastocyanin